MPFQAVLGRPPPPRRRVSRRPGRGGPVRLPDAPEGGVPVRGFSLIDRGARLRLPRRGADARPGRPDRAPPGVRVRGERERRCRPGADRGLPRGELVGRPEGTDSPPRRVRVRRSRGRVRCAHLDGDGRGRSRRSLAARRSRSRREHPPPQGVRSPGVAGDPEVDAGGGPEPRGTDQPRRGGPSVPSVGGHDRTGDARGDPGRARG
mmetsp:Transcript_13619/g.39771  ORF Transcript_13619/g.39771 Transcript_13619/m.39771 type:complete len:206 (-) Transcript_13619:1113-1730(-)